MKFMFKSLILAGSILASWQTIAGDLLQWQNNSLTYLYGNSFTINPSIQQTLTLFEHVDAWQYGDNFLFIDHVLYNGKGDNSLGSNTYYGEFTPRLSFSKIFNKKISFGLIQDVLLAMTYEFGKDNHTTYLVGPGFDLNVPGFDYFQLNFYQRHPTGDRPGDHVWQITPVWAYTMPIGNSDVLIDGYIDWEVNNDKNQRGTHHANLHFNPQIKYDLGRALHWDAKHLYVGFEYDFWKNKYGIDDNGTIKTNQNTTNFLVKYHF
ncbi:outer membrane protein OmpK [Candidatus Pseudomonas adelgestsugas]|uniref:Nucleoside-specific channel-forming protein, Tsx n=1 Tax=Candidatus Pseudomonas adelgestsugas TaxID=1302376 RepID=A0ABX5R988_9PSED|nr:outer membrane protein OmpK [Candidatus Pseudomonas adelgestsugas]QAX82133.1 Nucleoside-specific channel-forming protein, Tsx [Candidatus Pseudomonas adelgestsugas]